MSAALELATTLKPTRCPLCGREERRAEERTHER